MTTSSSVAVGKAAPITQRPSAQAEAGLVQQIWQQCIELIPDPILIADTETGAIVKLNHRAMALYGLDQERLQSENFWAYGADETAARQAVEEAIAEQRPVHFKATHIDADGTPIPVGIDGSVMRFGRKTFVLCAVRDLQAPPAAAPPPMPEGDGAPENGAVLDNGEVSENGATHAQEDAMDMRHLAEHVSDLVGLHNLDGTLVYASATATQMLGYEPTVLMGQSLFELAHADDAAQVQARFNAHLEQSDLSSKITYRIQHQEGQYLWVQTRLHSIRGAQGHPQKIISITSDLSDRMNFEGIRAGKEKAEQMSLLKSAFLANIGHEIRTPMASILGFSSMLAEEVEGELLEFTELIRRSSKRLLSTLDLISDLARLEAGSIRLDPSPLDVAGEARHSLSLVDVQAEESEVRLKFVPPSEPLEANLDPSALSRVLYHLLHFGIKMSPRGNVTVEVVHDETHAHIRVQDTSSGIDEALLPHLFEFSQREEGSLKLAYGGASLGLMIAKRYMDLMNGTITVDSSPHTGTRFVVSFPRIVKDTEVPAAALTERLTLLLVEDNLETQVLVPRLMRDFADVTVASTMEDALDQVQRNAFKAVLLDINLGEQRTGLDVLRAIRADERNQGLPVVAMTAYVLPGDRERFLRAGFDAYIGKPFTRNDLLQVLKELVPGTKQTAFDPIP